MDRTEMSFAEYKYDIVGSHKYYLIIYGTTLDLLRYRMAGITESAMVAYTHKYAVV